MMLIFDGKLMIFEAFWCPNIFNERVFYMWFCHFFDLKIASDDFIVLNMNGDFGPSRLSVKKRVFSFMMELVSPKIQKDACIVIDCW